MKGKKYTVCAVIAVILAAAVVAGLLLSRRGPKAVALDVDASPDIADLPAVTGARAVLENDAVRLELDTVTTHFTVTDKRSGAMFRSVAVAEDAASAVMSELTVGYYDSNSMRQTMDSAGNSVEWESFEVAADSTVIRVTYDLRKTREKLFVPSVFPREVFEEKILASLESGPKRRMGIYYKLYTAGDSGNADLLADYPELSDQDLYIVSTGLLAKDYQEITGYFNRIGYTEADYAEDVGTLSGASDSLDLPAEFVVPVEYRLTDGGFSATILTDKIENLSTSYTLTEIDLLPYFGSIGGFTGGTLLVPDGSGAIITCEERAGESYTQQLYGVDWSTDAQQTAQIARSAVMPVFGFDRSDSGFFAIIEGGAENAVINAQVIGGSNPDSAVWARFNIRAFDTTDIAAYSSIPVFNLYADSVVSERPQICYTLLDGDHCDYSGMAACYRDYLLEQGLLTERLDSKTPAVYLDYTGYITRTVSTMGVSHEEKLLMSTLTGIEESLSALDNAGVSGIAVRLTAYSNGGLTNALQERFALERAVGTVEQMETLASVISERGGRLYLENNLGRIYKNTLTDGYTRLTHAARRLNKMIVIRGENDIVLQDVASQYNSYDLLSPKYFPALVRAFTNTLSAKVEDPSLYGYSWADFGSRLWSDFNDSQEIDRAAAKGYFLQALKEAEAFGSVMTDGGSLYTLAAADVMRSVPLASSSFKAETDSIPFYAMVLHGYVSFTGLPLNTALDSEEEWLRTVESGAALSFSCYTEEDAAIRDLSDRQLTLPMAESVSRELIEERYAQYREDLARLAAQEITGHQIPQKGLHITLYEDGTRVAVNYNDTPVSVDGIQIAGKDYVVIFRGGSNE